MATFFDDSVLLAECKLANTQASVELPAYWDGIVPKANIRAYTKLRSIMFGRRFTATQFAGWGDGTGSDGYDWNLRLGVVYAFLEASKADEDRGAAYRAELKELLDELKTLDIVIANALAMPAGSPGKISSGDYAHSNDRFTMDEPDGSGQFSVGDGTRL